VKGFLQRSGATALPLVLVDGEIALAGRYPKRAELARWAGIEAAAPAAVATAATPLAETKSGCCSGKSGSGCC
jgi:hypothetical protein